MSFRFWPFSLAAILVASVVFGSIAGPVYATPADFENKKNFTESEIEEANAYSNAKWQELRETETWGNVQIIDALRWPDVEQASLGYVNKHLLEELTNPVEGEIYSYGLIIDELIRANTVDKTSVAKDFYAHFPLSDLESYDSRLGGETTEALAKAFGTPSKSVTFRHFQEVRLTPNLPEGMDPLQTLTVKITVPKGGIVAYLGDGKAILPLNTFMGYDLSSLKAPTALTAHQISADVQLPAVRSSIVLRDQDSFRLTKLGKELGILPEDARPDALRIDSSGFRGPVAYTEAEKGLRALTDATLFPDQEALKQILVKTFTVKADKGFHIRFTGETIPGQSGELIKGVTIADWDGRLGIVINVRVSSGPQYLAGTFIHENMHVVDLDANGQKLLSGPLADAFISNPNELEKLLEEEYDGGRLGTYWKDGLTDKFLEKFRIGSAPVEEKVAAFQEAFAEFGRFRFTGGKAGQTESLWDYFRGLAPNIADYTEASHSSYLRLPDVCGGAPLSARSARAAGGAGCSRVPMTEEELAELHKSNLTPREGEEGTKVFDEVDFTTSVETLVERDGRVLLSPLVNSNTVFARFDAKGGSESLEALSASLEKSLGTDLKTLSEVSSHSSTVRKALSAAGKGVSKASELLPYVAMAATGYALSEDVKTGNWVDAGFDGAAEGLMLVGEAQPELMVFTEPALLLDLAAQWVVDSYRAMNAPPPVMEPWMREQADRDKKTWDGLPGTLAELRSEEMRQQLVAATEQVMREKIIPALQARLAADEQMLDKLTDTYVAEAYVAEAYVAAAKAGDGAFAGAAWDKHEPQLTTTVEMITKTFAVQKENRRAAYVTVLGEQVQAVADHFGLGWAAGSVVFEHIRSEFDREIGACQVLCV